MKKLLLGNLILVDRFYEKKFFGITTLINEKLQYSSDFHHSSKYLSPLLFKKFARDIWFKVGIQQII